MRSHRAATVVVIAGGALLSQGCAIIAAMASGDYERAATAALEARERSKGAIDRIDDEDERAVGQGASFQVVRSYGGLVLEEDAVRYVNDVANLVAQQGKRQVLRSDGRPRIASRRFFVGILDDASYNAFALPGGYVFVTRGLLEDLGSESELAWVLGHEIAHVDYEDGLEVLKAQVGSGAFVTNGAIDFKDSKIFGRFVNMIAEHALQAGWDTNAELNADRLGLDYAAAAGYDPRAAGRVLQLLATRHTPPTADRSHASPLERWKELSGKADALAGEGAGATAAERFDTSCIRGLESYAAAKGDGASARGGSL